MKQLILQTCLVCTRGSEERIGRGFGDVWRREGEDRKGVREEHPKGQSEGATGGTLLVQIVVAGTATVVEAVVVVMATE